MSYDAFWNLVLQLLILGGVALIYGIISYLIVGMHLLAVRQSRLEEKKNGTLKL